MGDGLVLISEKETGTRRQFIRARRSRLRAALAGYLQHAFAGAKLSLDAPFQRGINFRSAQRFALCDRALWRVPMCL
jgi:hypothetical protein